MYKWIDCLCNLLPQTIIFPYSRPSLWSTIMQPSDYGKGLWIRKFQIQIELDLEKPPERSIPVFSQHSTGTCQRSGCVQFNLLQRTTFRTSEVLTALTYQPILAATLVFEDELPKTWIFLQAKKKFQIKVLVIFLPFTAPGCLIMLFRTFCLLGNFTYYIFHVCK